MLVRARGASGTGGGRCAAEGRDCAPNADAKDRCRSCRSVALPGPLHPPSLPPSLPLASLFLSLSLPLPLPPSRPRLLPPLLSFSMSRACRLHRSPQHAFLSPWRSSLLCSLPSCCPARPPLWACAEGLLLTRPRSPSASSSSLSPLTLPLAGTRVLTRIPRPLSPPSPSALASLSCVGVGASRTLRHVTGRHTVLCCGHAWCPEEGDGRRAEAPCFRIDGSARTCVGCC